MFRPALHLPRHVILAAAIIAKPDFGGIEAVQPRQRRVHGIVDLRALGGLRRRHMRFPEDATLDIGHDEERRADNAFISAIEERLGDRKSLPVERTDDPVFAVDGMRGRQQLSRWLAPQRVEPQRSLHQIGRIGLATLELADRDRPGKARDLIAQIGFEPAGVEAQALGDFARARKGVLAIEFSHGPGVYPAPKNSSNACAVAAGFSSAR